MGLSGAQHGGSVAQDCPAALQLFAPRGFKPPMCFQLASLQQLQSRLRTQRLQAQHRAVGALHGLTQRLQLRRGQAPLQGLQMAGQVVAVWHQQLRGNRGRWGAQVGGEVRKAEIRLVADGRNHRHGRGHDGADARSEESSR